MSELASLFLTALVGIGIWLVGVLIALPATVWWFRDVARIPRRVWYWSGYHRRPWQWSVLLGFVAGGVGALVVVAIWARSNERFELLAETREMRTRHDR